MLEVGSRAGVGVLRLKFKVRLVISAQFSGIGQATPDPKRNLGAKSRAAELRVKVTMRNYETGEGCGTRLRRCVENYLVSEFRIGWGLL